MAKEVKPLGTTVTGTAVSGPQSLYGQTVSLNFKLRKYFDSPTRDPILHMDTDRPTITIPNAGHISAEDLKCIWVNMKHGHIVLGGVPTPQFTKTPDVLEGHLSMVKQIFPAEIVKEHIKKIVSGQSLDGGYTKLEILEAMYDIEERHYSAGRGGRTRKEVLDFIKEAVKYVEDAYGGVSRVNVERPDKDNASFSGREFPQANITPEKARSILGLGK